MTVELGSFGIQRPGLGRCEFGKIYLSTVYKLVMAREKRWKTKTKTKYRKKKFCPVLMLKKLTFQWPV